MSLVGGNEGWKPRPGDTAPWFCAPALNNSSDFHFDLVAGHYVVLLFLGSAGSEAGIAALQQMRAARRLFDDKHALFFGVTRDSSDAEKGRIAPMLPGIRWFLDYDGAVARRYGAIDAKGAATDFWLLLDPRLRVVAQAPIDQGGALLGRLAAEIATPMPDEHAPVLIVPRVFEPGFCRHLIGLYEANGGEASGFMRDVAGVTTGMIDHRIKRRSDFIIEDQELRHQVRARLVRTLLPQIQRSFNFQATRIERYIVACYDGDGEGGFFGSHRDNTTAGTAHRRFACTINLNAEDYEGGDLVFPEFGPRRYRAPTGGAVVFSCGLLHKAEPVTRGKRYAYLPFLYDEAAAQQREAISKAGKVTGMLAEYRA